MRARTKKRQKSRRVEGGTRRWKLVFAVENGQGTFLERVGKETQLVQDAAKGPDVGLGSNFFSLIQINHLGGAVLQSCILLDVLLNVRRWGRSAGHHADPRHTPKVAQLIGPRAAGQQQILGLQISVDDRL